MIIVILHGPRDSAETFERLGRQFSTRLVINIFFSQESVVTRTGSCLILLRQALRELRGAMFSMSAPPHSLTSLAQQLLRIDQRVRHLRSRGNKTGTPATARMRSRPFSPDRV